MTKQKWRKLTDTNVKSKEQSKTKQDTREETSPNAKKHTYREIFEAIRIVKGTEASKESKRIEEAKMSVTTLKHPIYTWTIFKFQTFGNDILTN